MPDQQQIPAESTRRAYVALVHLIFLFSGAAALVYQVVWTRSLSLVFGGSHLAVTTVLAVFMGGLALGGITLGRLAVRTPRLLALYGWLELGIAAAAVLFAFLVDVYPSIYVPVARLGEDSPAYLSAVRVVFAVVVLLLPTTLMGGTLPILAAFVGTRTRELGRRISYLYGINTLGAVVGAGVAGFVLLPQWGLTASLMVAIAINVVLGVTCIMGNDRVQAALAAREREDTDAAAPSAARVSMPTAVRATPPDDLRQRLILWGIGISGFCALGYEVLWTRVLSIVIGASVYGFTVMLMAFLTGIALGSAAFGTWSRARTGDRSASIDPTTRSMLLFGLVQLVIGATALVVTVLQRDLPIHALRLQGLFLDGGTATFGTRQWVDFLLAFSIMCVPAFFMGVAFPLAGRIRAEFTGVTARAVGEVLAYNTVGAILGSAISGFVLIHAFGVERSLQLLALANVGLGVVVLVSTRRRAALTWSAVATVGVALVLLASAGERARLWDTRFFAVFETNRPDKFSSRAKIEATLRSTEVLYVAEGVSAIVSAVRVLGGTQTFVTNGRVEASDNPPDLACQYTLGHLPMLLHPQPRTVFVLGTGSGMTLGATSIHPSVERIVLAEIEPKVLGVARAFARYNHDVLDDEKLEIVFNDGRNFLLTTRERFDVITADPIHPWFSGAAYLYTKEYFDLAASRLTEGGVMCQWLPIYELDQNNLRSIVRTFAASFAHVMVWITHYDAHLVGSNAPFVLDVDELERRIAQPRVQDSLASVYMGTARDFLSFFLMGNAGAASYSAGATINTDDNLYLEFSAPLSIENRGLVPENYAGLVQHRENLRAYLLPAAEEPERQQQSEWTENLLRTAAIVDPLRVQELDGQIGIGEAPGVIARFDPAVGEYAPWRFLRRELEAELAQAPRLAWRTALPVRAADGSIVEIQLGAVVREITPQITSLDFVDGRDGRKMGRHDLLGTDLAVRTQAIVAAVAERVEVEHRTALERAREGRSATPGEEETFDRLERIVEEVVARVERGR